MRGFTISFIITTFLFSATAQVKEHTDSLISVIAFGSCGHQDVPWPVLNRAVEHQADLFVFLGDNIYGDTKKMPVLQKKYDKLAAKPEFANLWEHMKVIATWDDHDYGQNDGGKEYPKKKESKEIFLDFWQVPEEDARRERPSIYTSYYFEGQGKTVQVLVLDMRTFRDKLQRYNGEAVDRKAFHYGLDYWPHESDQPTMLGKQQWNWLEEQLQVPADVRIIASSTQFGISWNGYEAWANFPHEQKRFLDLIKKTRASGVVFISGDVHYAEVSRLQADGLYPIYDCTASGITSTWGFATPNDNRINGPIMENHIGLIKIDWSATDPVLQFQTVDVEGNIRIDRSVKLSEISF